MKKIKIGNKEYNCSNKIYWHIKGLESENNCFNMEIKSHEQSEYKLEQENKQLKERIDKAIESIEKELKENNHLSYGVALSIITILNDGKILKGE